MSDSIIIDRRKNPGKKSLSNRQRFMERFREDLKRAARKNINPRKISNDGAQEVSISGSDIDEPKFNHNPGDGQWDYVLPGNKEYIPGDYINKPKGGAGGGGGKKGGINGEGEDEFSFLLSYDEYVDLIFDDLELPDLIKKSEKVISAHQMRRAGYTTAGVPSNLNIEKTAISGLSRRIALKSPKLSEIHKLEEKLESETDEEQKKLILEEIERLKIRANAISYLDNVDLRYNNFVPQPKPMLQAVMFCVMDVSFSMGENEKIIAKKFFILLHLFLKRRYKNIEVVFVRHHEKAEECDEETFFTSRTSGGTVVSTAYEVVDNVIKERYNPNDWNIYVAQISDGDNYSHDSQPLEDLMSKVMPIVQFLAYVEISQAQTDYMYYGNTTLWETIKEVKNNFPQIEMNKVYNEREIISVFREFFTKGTK